MSEYLLFPPDVVSVTGPVIFLAGPIQGAPNWQARATELLRSQNAEIFIANPRREYLDGTFVYEKQVDWETSNLRRAADNGVLLFWLAKEETHDPKRAYAQTTRFELAEWATRAQREKVNMVIGIEQGYTGARYIRHRLSQDAPLIPILSSLEETCQKAMSLV